LNFNRARASGHIEITTSLLNKSDTKPSILSPWQINAFHCTNNISSAYWRQLLSASGLLGSHCCQVLRDLTEMFAYMNSGTHIYMLADSWRKPEGMVNETSPYRRFNEILPAHQTRVESDYTWRGTDRRDEAYAFLISPSKFHIIIILMPAMRMDMSRGGRTDAIYSLQTFVDSDFSNGRWYHHIERFICVIFTFSIGRLFPQSLVGYSTIWKPGFPENGTHKFTLN